MRVFSVESIYDSSLLRKVVAAARSARCRQRFAIPVILYEGKVRLLLSVYVMSQENPPNF